MRRLGVALLALMMLAGCEAGPSSSGAHGTVTKRWREEARNSPLKIYYLKVREDGGKSDTGRVSRKTYDACKVGARWPDCKPGR